MATWVQERSFRMRKLGASLFSFSTNETFPQIDILLKFPAYEQLFTSVFDKWVVFPARLKNSSQAPFPSFQPFPPRRPPSVGRRTWLLDDAISRSPLDGQIKAPASPPGGRACLKPTRHSPTIAFSISIVPLSPRQEIGKREPLL